jgi:hypothetical protein
MSDSESMSVDSAGSDLPNARPFVALGFHRTILDPATGRVKEEENHITHAKGTNPTNPLGMSSGYYQMALHMKYDISTDEAKPDGTTEKKYQCKNWHFELSGEKASAGNDLVDITVIFGTGSPLDLPLPYSVKPSEDSIIPLGAVELEAMQKFEVMLVGDVHRLFLDGQNLVLKKYVGNLRYYIQVNCHDV